MCHDVDVEMSIINGFIKGHSASVLESYLNSDDYYIDPFDETTNPFNKGSIILKVTPRQYIDSVKLKKTGESE